jgi:uncharacterized protein
MFTETKIEKKTYVEEFEPVQIFYVNDSNMTTISVPAVDREGNGVMATLSVEARPGIGRTLVDINQILFWVDTQDSIRTAKIVAKNVTGIDLSKYDIVYSIQANASVIEGPSAGAAMAIATILELEDKVVNRNVTITGTLDENGKIGRVTGVLAKAEAAKNAGMNLLLVPPGQRTYTVYTEEKGCEDYVFTKICRSTIKPEEVDVEEEVGIEVKEVSSVEEALKYFLA